MHRCILHVTVWSNVILYLSFQGIASTRNALGVRQGHLMHSANNLGDDDKKDLFGDIDSSSFRYVAKP